MTVAAVTLSPLTCVYGRDNCRGTAGRVSRLGASALAWRPRCLRLGPWVARLMGFVGLLLFTRVGTHSGSIRDSDTDCRLCWRFVLPDTHNVPACLFQELVGFVIAPTVLLDLVGPIVGVCLGDRVVVWASMPEASVEEDGNSSSRENDVGSPANCRHRSS